MWSPISHDWGHHVAGEEKPLSHTSKLHFPTILFFSSQPDGSPDYVTSVSLSDSAMHLPPVYVDGQIKLICWTARPKKEQNCFLVIFPHNDVNRNLSANNPQKKFENVLPKLWAFPLSSVLGWDFFFLGREIVQNISDRTFFRPLLSHHWIKQ